MQEQLWECTRAVNLGGMFSLVSHANRFTPPTAH